MSLRRAVLSLGRYSRWPLSELRGMGRAEFDSYLQSANGLIKDSPGLQ